MQLPTPAPRRPPIPGWPPDDPKVWAWVFASFVPSGIAWLLGVPFWVPSPGVETYLGTNPLLWMGAMSLLGLALALRHSALFQLALWLELVVGVALMLSLLQVPQAIFAVGAAYSGLEDVTYYELVPSFGLAFAAGAIGLGGVAYLLRLKLGIDASRARARKPEDGS
jgi:hypothetical protein